MEHTIEDYQGEKKALVTFSPNQPNIRLSNIGGTSPAKPGVPRTTPKNILDMHEAISRQFNDRISNEVTLTFTDKWIIPYNTNYIQLKVKDFFDRWSKVANYIMVQDYSTIGRVHYHGILEINQLDKFERLIVNLRKTFGRVECKQISFWESYIKYIMGVYDPLHEKFHSAIVFNRQRYITNKQIYIE